MKIQFQYLTPATTTKKLIIFSILWIYFSNFKREWAIEDLIIISRVSRPWFLIPNDRFGKNLLRNLKIMNLMFWLFYLFLDYVALGLYIMETREHDFRFLHRLSAVNAWIAAHLFFMYVLQTKTKYMHRNLSGLLFKRFR